VLKDLSNEARRSPNTMKNLYFLSLFCTFFGSLGS